MKPTPLWQVELTTRRQRAATHMDCPDCGSPLLVGPDADPGDLPATVAVDDVRLTRLGMYQALTAGSPIVTVHPGKGGLELWRLGDWARPDPGRTRLAPHHRCGHTHECTPIPRRADLDGPPPF